MTIQYNILPNSLQPGTFYARVIQGNRVELDRMMPNIMAKTSLSEADVRGVLLATAEEVIAVLVNGDTPVIDNMVYFNLSLSGNFSAPDATVNPQNAELNVNAHVDSTLHAKVENQAIYERATAQTKVPIIEHFFDISTEAYNKYTAGSIVRLLGKNLKFDKSDPTQGVFVNDGSTETRLSVYSVNGDHQIDTLMPNSMTGPLTITVRAKYTPNGSLRAETFQQQVTAA